MFDREKIYKYYNAAKSLSKVTSIFSATGATIETYFTGKPEFISIGVFAISSSFLCLNEYLIFKLEKETLCDENQKTLKK